MSKKFTPNFSYARVTFPLTGEMEKDKRLCSEILDELASNDVFDFDYTEDEVAGCSELDFGEATIYFPVKEEEDYEVINETFKAFFDKFEIELVKGYHKYVVCNYETFMSEEGEEFELSTPQFYASTLQAALKKVIDIYQMFGGCDGVKILEFFFVDYSPDNVLVLETKEINGRDYDVIETSEVFRGTFE